MADTELEPPTEAEDQAEEFLRALIEQLCGDPAQAEWHLWACRRRALARLGTSFNHYLVTLAAELPQLLTDLAACRHAYLTQHLLNQAQQTLAEQDG